MSTLQDVVGQLVEELRYAYDQCNRERFVAAMDELMEWGYIWTSETGLVKLPEGEEAKS